MKKTTLFLLILLLGAHLFLLVNLRFTAWPEMLAYPYLRNNGFLLYKDMIHPYPPVLTMALSIAYKWFGYKLWVMKVATWSMILVNDVLIYLIIKKLTKSIKWSMIGVLFYVFLQPFLEGNMLWFDLAIVPPILLGTLFLLQNSSKKKLFFAGLFFAVAALIKQTAGVFLIFSTLYLVYKRVKLKNLAYFLLGPIILVVPLAIRLLTERAFIDFLNWTIVYPTTFWSKFPGYVQMNLSPKQLSITLLLFVPFLFLIFRARKIILRDKKLVLLLAFLIGGIISIYPRFSFFHFQITLAFLAILFGYLIKQIKTSPMLIVVYFLLLIFAVCSPAITLDWQKEARFYGSDDLEMARIITEKTKEDEKVFLFGLYSGLYPMANRLPPKRWIDNFGWYLEVPGIQEEIILRWERNPPVYVFWLNPEPGNWFDPGTYQPKKIAKWIEENYTKETEIRPEVWIWKKKD